MTTTFSWPAQGPLLFFTAPEDGPVRLTIGAPAPAPVPDGISVPQTMVEILAVDEGHALTNIRNDRSQLSERLRYVSHAPSSDAGWDVLEVTQRDDLTGVTVLTRFEARPGCAAFRATTTIDNTGTAHLGLQTTSSIAVGGLSGYLGPLESTELLTARNEWCGESRWHAQPLMADETLVDINTTVHGQAGRGTFACSSNSTWSSGTFVPVAALTNRSTGSAVVWQLENPGPWNWELNTQADRADWYTLVLMGPTDLDHSWLKVLEPGESFTTIPVSVAASPDSFEGAVATLTDHRRASQLEVARANGRPLIFNDYMNALMGDPTTEKLLPLIDAAAEAGAECFCIDAGWYDDGGDWWPSVGEWQPSTVRFGENGLQGVLDHIKSKGLKLGLWVEPEVIGVKSPMATKLPEDAFMHRAGFRIVEGERHFLDLRSQSARDFLDDTFKRLIEGYGASYFKLDYNVTPGTGPDTDADSPGDGLLEHVRAHLAWFEALRERYPHVIFEACSSGAQRMDQAILSRFDLQSSSDQQDYRLYPTIAAAAPMAMAPEQAGNWAYPQSEMTLEQMAFNLVTGLSGRLYLSGNIDKIDDEQMALVKEATAAYPAVIAHHGVAHPHWPLGLPEWDAPVVALATETDDEAYVFVWKRTCARSSVDLPLTWAQGTEADVETVFPTACEPWGLQWSAASATLNVDCHATTESARVIRVRKRR